MMGFLLQRISPLLALSGQGEPSPVCPLLGVKQTLPLSVALSAYDPKRPWSQLAGVAEREIMEYPAAHAGVTPA